MKNDPMHGPFSNILGQHWAISYLSGAVSKGRLPQTMIFSGPAYVGKETTAIALASLLLCERGSGCGECVSCRQVLSYQHPDLHYFFPCPASWYQDKPGAGEVIISRADPGNRLGEPLGDPNHVISIDAVRRMTRIASRSSFGGRAKVFVIRNADRMKEEGQNALLKLLEEAPADTYLILLSASPGGILPTVRSRAHRIRFSSLNERDWIVIFTCIREVEEQRALLLYRLSGGSLAKGASLLEEESTEERLLALDLVSGASRAPQGFWAARAIGRFGDGRDREGFDRLLDHILLWLRDALVWSDGGGASIILNRDRPDAVSEVARRLTKEQLVQLIWEFEHVRQSMRLNLDLRLVCYRMERLVRLIRERSW